MTQKIQIAKAGYDAVTETNPDHLTFSSDYNTLKYALSGSYVMTTSATVTVTIPHNLGYVPFFVVYANIYDVQPAEYAIVPYMNLQSPLRATRAYVDANNLYLSFNYGGTTSVTINWSYKIFKNNLGF